MYVACAGDDMVYSTNTDYSNESDVESTSTTVEVLT